MDRIPPNPHAGHDELLIALLFGDDASDSERAHALDLMATCPECESLYADLGAISEAMAGLPAPARPRDFRLTEVDAVRLARPSRNRWAVFGPGLRRSLGGSLAALGIVGVLLTGASSVLSGTAANPGAGDAIGPERAATMPERGATAASSGGTAAFVAGGGATAGPAVLPTAAPAATAAAAASAGAVLAATSAAPATDPNPVAMVPASTSPASLHNAAASPGPAQGNIDAGSEPTKASPAGIGSGGIDARLALAIGFAALFGLGLAIAILPGRRRGRDRDATS
jgi:hypothetical protein